MCVCMYLYMQPYVCINMYLHMYLHMYMYRIQKTMFLLRLYQHLIITSLARARIKGVRAGVYPHEVGTQRLCGCVACGH